MTESTAARVVLTLALISATAGAGSAHQNASAIAPAIVLVVDISASAWSHALSMRSSAIQPGFSFRVRTDREAVFRIGIERGFIDHLPAAARARVGLASHRLTVNESFTSDRSRLRDDWRALQSFDRRESGGPSRIWDATARAVQLLAEEPGARHVVLVTDGQATGNVLTAEELIAIARERRVSIHVVSVGFDMQLPEYKGESIVVRPNDALRRIAAATGGEFFVQNQGRPRKGITHLREGRWGDLSEPLGALMQRLGNRK